MPPAPRKRAPRKATPKAVNNPPTAADQAAIEADAVPPKVIVPWRGVTFEISHDILRSGRVALALEMGRIGKLIFEILGDYQAAVFLETIEVGEDRDVVIDKFLTALNDAGGWGNSAASS